MISLWGVRIRSSIKSWPVSIAAIGTLATLLAFASASSAENSDLWGTSGEKWNPRGRLPDFSYAGYHNGDKPIPDVPIWRDLKSYYGAKGDGITDDTAALKRAVADFPGTQPGAIYLPAGLYKISDRIVISKSNLVIRGAGKDKTRIAFTRGIWQLYLANGSPMLGYSGPHMIEFQNPNSPRTASKYPLIGTVTAAANLGDRTIQLDSVQRPSGAAVSPGQYVKIVMYNDESGHLSDPNQDNNLLLKYIAFDQPTSAKRLSYQDFGLVQWIVKVDAVDATRRTLTLHQPLILDFQPTKWKVEVREPNLVLTESGIEYLSIDFPPVSEPFVHHNAKTINGISYSDWTDGHNGVGFNNVFNCWMRGVKITDADDSVGIEWGAANVSLLDIDIMKEDRGSTSAHYGIRTMEYTHNILADNVNFGTGSASIRPVHTISTQVNHNIVYSRIYAYSLRMDHHGYAFSCLLTDSKTDTGEALGGTSPSRAMSQGRGGTFWNILSANGKYGQATVGTNNTYFGMERWGGNFIGVNKLEFNTVKDLLAPVWIEKWTGTNTSPANLYISQLARRLGSGPVVLPATNSAPVAGNNSYSVQSGSVLSVSAPGVLANDSDTEGDSLTAVLASAPGNGKLVLNSNGSFSYTPNAGYSGADSFSYRASDGQISSNLASVSISVSPVPIVATLGKYEAENAVISRGQVNSDHPGFSGAGFVNYDNLIGSYVEWNVSVADAGSYSLNLRYANGSGFDRPMEVKVNGVVAVANLSFAATANWDSWQDRKASVTLKAGSNLIRATAIGSQGGPNVDYLSAIFSSSSGSLAIEAESAILTAPMAIGLDSLASGGKYVSVPNGLGNNYNDATQGGGAQASFSVNLSAGGTYALWARVLAPNGGDDSFYVNRNGILIKEWMIPDSATWAWQKVGTVTMTSGGQTVNFRLREDGTKLDRIILTNNLNFVPSGLSGGLP